ncbi:MAG: PAS domain S-box protein [Candidatus Omnitrophica bacterium]|nr:PAS domain S-box protein [Candidatus Omnitrophota bacterium]
MAAESNPSKKKSLLNDKNVSPIKMSQFFLKVVSVLGDEVLVLDSSGQIIYANSTALKALGFSEDEILCKKIVDLLADKISIDDWKKIHFNLLKKRAKPISFTAKRITHGGIVQTVDITATYLEWNNEEFIVTVARNISEQLAMQNKIVEDEKLKALKQFIAGTTQEIQAPLRGLLARTQSLIDQYKDRDFEYVGYKEYKSLMNTLNSMHNQVKYCFDTTYRLLTINRRKVGIKDHHCNVNTIMFEGIRMVRHNIQLSNIKLVTKFDPAIPEAAIGTLEFSQVIINVLNNAIQAIPLDGKIQLKTKYLIDQDLIQIECKDTGVGIPADVLPHVFEPFYTTKQRGVEKNSGLGLAIAHTIIKSYKGEIKINSNLRLGTTVTITLPVYPPKKVPRVKD